MASRRRSAATANAAGPCTVTSRAASALRLAWRFMPRATAGWTGRVPHPKGWTRRPVPRLLPGQPVADQRVRRDRPAEVVALLHGIAAAQQPIDLSPPLDA